jgi:hypothetical protein
MTGGEHDSESDDAVGPDEQDLTGIDRRNLMRKAALGAAVTGAVWAAPKIEGLSLRPDYASAGSTGGGGDNPAPALFDFKVQLSSGAAFTQDTSFPVGAGFGIKLSQTADAGGTTFTALKTSGPPNCGIGSVTFDGRFWGSGNPPGSQSANVPSTITPTPPNQWAGHWNTDDGGLDADFSEGGNAHVHIVCT